MRGPDANITIHVAGENGVSWSCGGSEVPGTGDGGVWGGVCVGGLVVG